METVSSCFLCCNDTIKQNQEFFNIHTSIAKASQKPIYVVLQHLANRLKYKLIFQSETSVCSDCFKAMCDYDDLMLNLISSQKRLTALLQNVLVEKLLEEEEKEQSTVEDDNEQSMNIELEFGNDEDDPILVDALNPDLDSEEELIQIYEGLIEEETAEDQEEQLVTIVAKCDSSNSSQKVNKTKARKKKFRCKICGVWKKDEDYLKLHMNIHEGKTENECRYCPKRFIRPLNTLRHMRIHWDKKKFQCEKCGERFLLYNMLYNHRLCHEAEENPLICGVCKQSFKSRKTYTHHLLIHKKNRPRHHCHLCPKSFSEGYTLKMHLKTHSCDNSNKRPTSTIVHKSSLEDKESETEETIGIFEDNEN